MASSSLAVRVLPEELRSLAFGDISGSYAALGDPLAHPARIMLFQNATDKDVLVSWDGVTDHMMVPVQSFILVDVGTNKGIGSEFAVAQETQFYVKDTGVATTLGAVYLTVLYGKE